MCIITGMFFACYCSGQVVNSFDKFLVMETRKTHPLLQLWVISIWLYIIAAVLSWKCLIYGLLSWHCVRKAELRLGITWCLYYCVGPIWLGHYSIINPYIVLYISLMDNLVDCHAFNRIFIKQSMIMPFGLWKDYYYELQPHPAAFYSSLLWIMH